MLHPNFVILGVIIGFAGGLSYIISTIKGKTKPNRVTWFFWALAPLIAFVAEIKEGVGIQSWMTFGVGFGPLLIFLASFVNKESVWKLRKFDFICGVLALLGLFLWYMTRNGNFAIFFSILTDVVAATPTFVKSYSFPETENYHTYLTAATSAAITLLTIDIWNFAHFGFPLYILILCTTFVFLIKFRAGKFIKKLKII
jgi:hypothetical protein